MDRIENMFIADEAQLLVPKIISKALATDTWVTTDFSTRLRKRGESLVIITQSPSNIEDNIRKKLRTYSYSDYKTLGMLKSWRGCSDAFK